VRVLALVVLALLVVGCGGGGLVGVPATTFPFAAGTTWTARHTQTPSGGSTQTGTFTVIYRGTLTYRGATYHAADGASTLTPGLTERTHFAWNPVARTAATVLTDASGTLEIIFSDPFITIGGNESRSGTTQVFFNGAFQGTGNYSVSTASAGTFSVTVPAGTFTTTRWNWNLLIGLLGTNASSYAVGNASEVRRDATTSQSGTTTGTYFLELITGPVATGASASEALSRAGVGTLPHSAAT